MTSYLLKDEILVFESGNSYRNPPRRCGCGSPIARTSSLETCHCCYDKERQSVLREKMSVTANGGRMDRYKHYAERL